MKLNIRNSIATLAVAVCALSPLSAGASPYGDTQPRLYWGMRAEIDVTLPSKFHTVSTNHSETLFKPGMGVNVGAICNIPLVSNLYLEPGANLYYGYYSYDVIISDGEDSTTEDPTVKKFGLRVPVDIGYRFNLSDGFALSLFTGPQLDWGITGSVKYKNPSAADEDAKHLLEVYGNGDYGQRHISMSWRVGIGVEINHDTSLALVGNLGVTDLMKHKDYTFRENSLGLVIGYNF